MPGADSTFGWREAMAAFAIIAIVAFLVTWLVTDRGHVSRTPYIAILFLTTLILSGGYVAWSGTSVVDLVTARWGWGIVAPVVAHILLHCQLTLRGDEMPPMREIKVEIGAMRLSVEPRRKSHSRA